MQQFSRTELLVGKQACEKLQNCHVAVFGLGGVGSFAVEALARAGVGELTLVDCDTVDETNLNRQLYALHSTLNQNKTDVAKARVLDINPLAKVNAVFCRFDASTQSLFDFSKFDFVVDAIDTVTSKILLAQICNDLGTSIVCCLGTGNKLHPELLEIADISQTSVCPLAKVMRKELKLRGINHLKVVFSKEQPRTPQQEQGVRRTTSSISFVPPVAGMLLASVVVNGIIEN